ncbi:Uncharacterised protein [Serratia fonticola]|nr:Uncharacterised protein [Serratia fonticola]
MKQTELKPYLLLHLAHCANFEMADAQVGDGIAYRQDFPSLDEIKQR